VRRQSTIREQVVTRLKYPHEILRSNHKNKQCTGKKHGADRLMADLPRRSIGLNRRTVARNPRTRDTPTSPHDKYGGVRGLLGARIKLPLRDS